ncbi:MAG: hypothetical protein V4597_06245 [Pseudomonadota bacterium]
MIYRVEFYKGDERRHYKDIDLGLEAARQHAVVMAKHYGATTVRIVDKKRREVISYVVQSEA